MHSETLIKASLVQLMKGSSSTQSVAGAGPSADFSATLKERLPQELFDLRLGNDTLVESVREFPRISEIFREMQSAEKAINDRAAALGWVGTPTSAFSVSQADGYVRHFQNASIYWTRQFGAKEVHGAIRERYFQMGAENSYLGFPQTDELSTVSHGEEVRYSNFQGGSILWTATRGAFQNPSFSPITERHQLGAWLHMVGKGFTPNSRVSLWIVNAPNAPQSMGSLFASSDGRFGSNPEARHVVDLRNRSGDHEASIARAVDEATGQASDYPLSYALF
jgi:hypothetical protein